MNGQESLANKLWILASETISLAQTCAKNPSRSFQNASAFFDLDQTDIQKLSEGTLIRYSGKPPLPCPSLLRKVLKARSARGEMFGGNLFADPAWDMILDLTIARVEGQRVSVTSLCTASGVPTTTALRWIAQMVELGIFERLDDDQDRRRKFIALSDKSAASVAKFFSKHEYALF